MSLNRPLRHYAANTVADKGRALDCIAEAEALVGLPTVGAAAQHEALTSILIPTCWDSDVTLARPWNMLLDERHLLDITMGWC